MSTWSKGTALGILCILVALLGGCAAGPNSRFVDTPAGFWAGVWHGLICVITFIISLFSDGVRMYEVHNSGAWYDLGFILGACIAFGGSGGAGWKRKKSRSPREKEWEEIGVRVEEKVRKGIKEWLDESEKREDWDEIARNIEEKIKKKLRDWAEE
jgi:hypothetical protein